MKTKKKSNRRTRHPAYTPGRNIFGQRAKTELVIVERETAFQQIAECVLSLKENKRKEFTLDLSCFDGHEDERDMIMKKISVLMALQAGMQGVPYCDGLV